jgi:hypothetical protein
MIPLFLCLQGVHVGPRGRGRRAVPLATPNRWCQSPYQVRLQSGGLEDAPWPHQFVETCEAGLNLLMTDQEAFVEFITESTRQLADAKRPREQPMPTHDAVEPFSSFRSGGACSVPRPWALPTLPGRGPPVPGDLRSGCLRVQIVI